MAVHTILTHSVKNRCYTQPWTWPPRQPRSMGYPERYDGNIT